MTHAWDRWPDLFWFFDVMHQDYDADYSSPDACMSDAASEASTEKLGSALAQWHEAFDEASDEGTAKLVETFNPWWDAKELFGGPRQWAEWVRGHLERELAARNRPAS